MPTSGDLKSGDCLFFTHYPPEFHRHPSPPPRKIDPAPNGNDLGRTLYDVLHDAHTIKIRNYRFYAAKIPHKPYCE